MPRQALYVGLAGVVPYLVTSLSTVYLSFDIQYAAHHGNGFLIDGKVAEQLLHIIEPIQLGYGATVCSIDDSSEAKALIRSTDHLFPRRHSLGS